jgi:hypothetical protein
MAVWHEVQLNGSSLPSLAVRVLCSFLVCLKCGETRAGHAPSRVGLKRASDAGTIKAAGTAGRAGLGAGDAAGDAEAAATAGLAAGSARRARFSWQPLQSLAYGT